jgi:hypothetical protein
VKKSHNIKQAAHFKPDKSVQHDRNFQIATGRVEKDKLAHFVEISTLLYHF